MSDQGRIDRPGKENHGLATALGRRALRNGTLFAAVMLVLRAVTLYG